VRVVTLHPTGVDTPVNDGLALLGDWTAIEIAEKSAGNLLPTPWVTVEDVVGSVLFLASDDARFITGSALVLDVTFWRDTNSTSDAVPESWSGLWDAVATGRRPIDTRRDDPS